MFDGVFIPEAICQYKGISPGAKLAYGRFCRFAGRTGEVFPSMATLGKEIGCCANQARSYVKELVDDRFVEVESEPGRVNSYYFLWHTAFDGEIGSVRFSPLQDAGGVEVNVATPPGCWSTPLQDAGGVPLQDAGDERESVEESQERESIPPVVPHSENLLDLEDDPITYVQNLYKRENRRAKLDNLRARSGERLCEDIRRAESNHGAVEFRTALITYLNDPSEWLREKRWPIHVFLKQVDKYISDSPQTPRAPRTASPGSIADQPQATNWQPSPDAGLKTGVQFPQVPKSLPEEADVWNEVVTAGVPIAEFDWEMEEGKSLRRCRDQVRFTATAWRTVCEKAQKALENECGWVTFRWLIKNDNNWWKVLQGEYDTYKAKQPKAAKPSGLTAIEQYLTTLGG